MKKRLIFLLAFSALLCTLFSTVDTFAQTEEYILHVSPSGDDKNSGTKDSPLASMAEAVRRGQAYGNKQQVRCILHEGKYFIDETTYYTKSALVNAPLIIEGAEGENVVLTGAKSIDATAFHPVTDEAIKALIPEEARDKVLEVDLASLGFSDLGIPDAFNWLTYNMKDSWVTLFRNGKEQDISQWPNGYYNYDLFDRTVYTGASAARESSVFSFKGARPAGWTTAKYAWIGCYPNAVYLYSRANLQKVNLYEQTISTAHGFTYELSDKTKVYKVFNLIEELDIPGEWYLDPDTLKLYYYPPEDFCADDLIEMSVGNNLCLQIRGNNIIIKNITFEKSRATFIEMNASNVTIENCRFLYGKNLGINMLPGTGRFLINNNVFKHIDSNAIYTHGGAHYTGIKWSELKNNYFSDIGKEAQNCGHAVYNIHSYLIAEGNTFCNMKGGAFFQVPEYLKFRYNEMYGTSQQFGDQGAFYCGQNGQVKGIELTNNLLYDFHLLQPLIDNYVFGLYFDDGFSNAKISNNIIVNGDCSGIEIGGGRYNDISGNIIVDMNEGSISIDNRGETWGTAAFEKQGTTIKASSYNKQNLKIAPHFIQQYQNILQPIGNYVAKNVMTEKPSLTEHSVAENNIVNNALIKDKSCFVDPAHMDYRLKEDSEYAKFLPQMTESGFDFNRVGCDTALTADADKSFKLVYPYNNEERFNSKDIITWEMAEMADRYIITVSSDEDMKNVVTKKEVKYNYTDISSLEPGKTYYWKVTAKNDSFKRYGEWDNIDGIHKFTTATDSSNNYDDLEYYIGVVEHFLSGIDKSLYRDKEKDDLNDAIADSKLLLANKNAQNQDEIDGMGEKLMNSFAKLKGAVIIKDVPLKTKYFESLDNWTLNIGGADINGKELSFSRKNDAKVSVNLNEMPELDSINRFDMKIDFNSDSAGDWVSVEMRRRGDLSRVLYEGQTGFMIILKQSMIEFHRYPGSLDQTVDNVYFKDNEWFTVTAGTQNYDDYVRVVFAINDSVIFDYNDYTETRRENGYLNFMSTEANNGFSLRPASAPSDNQNDHTRYYNSKGYTYYSEKGEWSDISASFEDFSMRAASGEAYAEWKISPYGGKKGIYFYKHTSENGCKNAKVTLYVDVRNGAAGDETTVTKEIDFSSGDDEWIYLGDAELETGYIVVSVTGDGSGEIYTGAVEAG